MSGGLARRRRREARDRARAEARRHAEEHPEEYAWVEGRLRRRATLQPHEVEIAVGVEEAFEQAQAFLRGERR